MICYSLFVFYYCHYDTFLMFSSSYFIDCSIHNFNMVQFIVFWKADIARKIYYWFCFNKVSLAICIMLVSMVCCHYFYTTCIVDFTSFLLDNQVFYTLALHYSHIKLNLIFAIVGYTSVNYSSYNNSYFPVR